MQLSNKDKATIIVFFNNNKELAQCFKKLYNRQKTEIPDLVFESRQNIIGFKRPNEKLRAYITKTNNNDFYINVTFGSKMIFDPTKYDYYVVQLNFTNDYIKNNPDSIRLNQKALPKKATPKKVKNENAIKILKTKEYPTEPQIIYSSKLKKESTPKKPKTIRIQEGETKYSRWIGINGVNPKNDNDILQMFSILNERGIKIVDVSIANSRECETTLIKNHDGCTIKEKYLTRFNIKISNMAVDNQDLIKANLYKYIEKNYDSIKIRISYIKSWDSLSK